MNYIRYISQRYLFSKSGNNAINIIVKIASFGVLMVSAAFIIVLSGFSGIRTFNVNLIKMTDADIKITPKTGKSFVLDKELTQFLKHDKAVQNFSKVIEEKVFINYNDKQKIAKIKGVDSNYYNVINLDSTLISGHLPKPNTIEMLMGVSLANDLSFMLSNNLEMIQLLVPKPGKGFITDPRKAFYEKYFVPVGIFQTTPDHDHTYLYATLKGAQQLLHYQPGQITAIEIKVMPNQIIALQKRLQARFGKQLYIRNRQQLNKLLYKMLNTENLMVYFIFALILLLALFNIVGTIIMIIIDKKDNIHTLRVLGLDRSEIKKIFMIQGLGMTVLSGLVGLIFGLVLIGIQQFYPFLYIPQTNMPYPVEFHWSNILYVLLTIIFMGSFATLIGISKIEK